jgi:hypothetical protein
MNSERELFPEVSFGSEADKEATATPRSVGLGLLAGGLLGLMSSLQQPALQRRERVFAAGGSAATIGLAILALKGRDSLVGPARRAPVPFSVACYGGAVATTVLGGGHRAPGYFPAVLLTAAGGGVGGDLRTGRRGGAAVALAYLGGCALTLEPWRTPLSRDAWWNAAAACGFIGAGIVGAIAGDLTLKSRALTDYAEREAVSAGREEIEEAAAEVRRLGSRFLDLLPQVQQAFAEDPSVGEATDDLATALGSLGTVRALVPPPDRQALGTWPRLQEIVDSYNAKGGNSRVVLRSAVNPPPSADAAATGVLCDCATGLIQNAANARRKGAPPVEVVITLDLVKRRRRAMLVMSIEDDAGGRPVPRSEWGKGLSESSAAAEERVRGGDFRLEQGERGLRVVIEIPYVRGRGGGSLPLTFTTQAIEGRDAALRSQRLVTLAQAMFLALAVSEREAVPRRLASIAAIFGVGELAQLLPERPRALAAAALGPVAMSAFEGYGRPPMGGWSAVMCAQAASTGAARQSWVAAALATVGATVVAGPERFGKGMEFTVGDRTFALVGTAIGAGIERGIQRLREQEEHVGHEAWRRQVLADLATPGRIKHHLLNPVEKALGKEDWGKFEQTELGRELIEVRGEELWRAQRKLEGLLRAGNPLRELQTQLARLLAPAPVRVFGKGPERTRPRQGQELDAVRYRLGLLGLGQAIAARVRDYLPTSFLFRDSLQELQVHVEPGYEETRFTLVQVPFKASDHDRADAVLDVASRRAGGRAGGTGSDRFEVLVHNTALG